MPHLLPIDLSSGAGAELLAKVANAASPQLAALASRFVRIFIVSSPWAPGFCCVGGALALDPAAQEAYGAPSLSVTGNGDTLERALTSCLGEAADRLSQAERPGDIGKIESSVVPNAAGWIAQATERALGGLDWVEARDAVTDCAAALPADLCLRRPAHRRAIEPVVALSAGVAAGPDFEWAAVRAGLELCERDAAAAWWLGGRRPQALPAEHSANAAGATLIAALRQGRTDRPTTLLDITTDLGVPAIAAVSLNQDGRGLACGLAARLDWQEAACAAILEMCQMELAAPLAAAKRAEQGDAALNDIDRRHLQRAAFAAAECGVLRPGAPSAAAPPASIARHRLRDFAIALNRRGVRLLLLDLTRPDIDVPVVRAVCADLQPYTANIVTERLRRWRAENHARHLSTAEIPLM